MPMTRLLFLFISQITLISYVIEKLNINDVSRDSTYYVYGSQHRAFSTIVLNDVIYVKRSCKLFYII